MHLVTSLNYVKKNISKLLSIINFCSKTRTKPKPSSRIRTENFENNSFWGKKKKSGVGGLTSSLPLI
jgi:ligand-binding sensor protein